MGIGKEDVHNVADTTPHAVQPYEVLLLGCSTWGVGEMQDDWNDFLFKLKDMDLKNKTVALFGCGDSVSFSSSFCDALGVIYHELQHTGCTFTGEVDPLNIVSMVPVELSTVNLSGSRSTIIMNRTEPIPE